MASQEDEDLGSGTASNNSDYFLDWDKFDQNVKDVLSLCSGGGGAKRSRDEVESYESPSASSSHGSISQGDDVGQSLAEAPPAKRKKTGGEDEDEDDEGGRKEEMAKDRMYRCAACGLEAEEYKEMEKHVQVDHQVGDDQELVVASILVNRLQAGVKTCPRQFVDLMEQNEALNIEEINICRVCSGKFSSDEELTHHIQAWHSGKFANGDKKNEVSLPCFSPEVSRRRVIIRPEEADQPQPRRKRSKKRDKKRKTSVKDRKRKMKEKEDEESFEDEEEEESFQVKAPDLKYKLRKFREKHCEACEVWTSDWASHQLTSDHRINDKKKTRCLYCPRRLRYASLKLHLAESHAGSSFTCSVTPNCSMSLIDVSRMVEHINTKHGKSVRSLIQTHGAHWDTDLSQFSSRELSSLLSLPSDLRKLTCRKCDLSFLCQDQSALEEHFRLAHPDLNSTEYSENIIYSCRVCLGVVFGSEKHLLHHIQESHQAEGGGSPAPVALKSVVVVPKEKLQPRSAAAADADQEDLDQYRDIISKIRNEKLKKTRKINTFKTKKVCSNEAKHSQAEAEDSPSKEPGPVEEVVNCYFCEAKMFQSSLSSHLERRHKAEMFSCDGSCGRQVFSPWQERLLHHLRRDHGLSAKTDQDLLDQHLGLPASLEMISCKGGHCGSEATFLGRHLSHVNKTLLKHSRKKHRAQSIGDCFVLGCRVCPGVWSLEDVEAWDQHCRQEHRSGQAKDQLNHNNNQLTAPAGPEAASSPSKPRDDENLDRISGCQDESKMKTSDNSERL